MITDGGHRIGELVTWGRELPSFGMYLIIRKQYIRLNSQEQDVLLLNNEARK